MQFYRLNKRKFFVGYPLTNALIYFISYFIKGEIMTSEEVDRSIKVLFDHQAKLTEDISRLEGSIEILTKDVAELKSTMIVIGNSVNVIGNSVNVIGNNINTVTKDVQNLTEIMARFIIEGEAERQIIKNRMDRFEEQANRDREQANRDRQNSENRMARFEKQAERDRQDSKNRMAQVDERMEQRMSNFEKQAELDRAEMRNIMKGLVDIVGNTSKRVTATENRLDTLENHQ